MNEDQNPNPQPSNEPTPGQAIPYQRFKAVNDKYRAALAELEQLRAGNAAPAATGDTTEGGDDGGNTPTPAPAPATPPAGNIRNRPASGSGPNPSGSVANNDGQPDYRAQYEAASAELAAMKIARSRDRAALAVGLPLELSDKLAGNTDAEIRADAERLARYVGNRPKAPNLNGSTPSGTDPGFSLSQIENAVFYDQHRDAIHAAFARGAIRK